MSSNPETQDLRHQSPLKDRSKSRKRSFTPLLLGLPALAIVIVAQAYPLFNQFIMSFQEFGLSQQFGQAPEWVGLDNYSKLLTDPTFWAVLGRTLVFCVVCAVLTLAIGTATAVFLMRLNRLVRVLIQSAMLLAWATPVLSTLTVWQWLFATHSGLVNWILTRIGFEKFDGYSWLLESFSFFAIAAGVVIWMSVPLAMLLIYASLSQVNGEMLEASELDGANAWERFWQIVIPTIAPVLMVVLLLQVIWDLRVFTQIKVLQEAGGVSSETNVLGTYIYQVGLAQGDYATGSAIATILLILTMGLSWGYLRSLLRQGDLK